VPPHQAKETKQSKWNQQWSEINTSFCIWWAG
jgi:hypothetical protein